MYIHVGFLYVSLFDVHVYYNAGLKYFTNTMYSIVLN